MAESLVAGCPGVSIDLNASPYTNGESARRGLVNFMKSMFVGDIDDSKSELVAESVVGSIKFSLLFSFPTMDFVLLMFFVLSITMILLFFLKRKKNDPRKPNKEVSKSRGKMAASAVIVFLVLIVIGNIIAISAQVGLSGSMKETDELFAEMLEGLGKVYTDYSTSYDCFWYNYMRVYKATVHFHLRSKIEKEINELDDFKDELIRLGADLDFFKLSQVLLYKKKDYVINDVSALIKAMKEAQKEILSTGDLLNNITDQIIDQALQTRLQFVQILAAMGTEIGRSGREKSVGSELSSTMRTVLVALYSPIIVTWVILASAIGALVRFMKSVKSNKKAESPVSIFDRSAHISWLGGAFLLIFCGIFFVGNGAFLAFSAATFKKTSVLIALGEKIKEGLGGLDLVNMLITSKDGASIYKGMKLGVFSIGLYFGALSLSSVANITMHHSLDSDEWHRIHSEIDEHCNSSLHQIDLYYDPVGHVIFETKKLNRKFVLTDSSSPQIYSTPHKKTLRSSVEDIQKWLVKHKEKINTKRANIENFIAFATPIDGQIFNDLTIELSGLATVGEPMYIFFMELCERLADEIVHPFILLWTALVICAFSAVFMAYPLITIIRFLYAASPEEVKKGASKTSSDGSKDMKKTTKTTSDKAKDGKKTASDKTKDAKKTTKTTSDKSKDEKKPKKTKEKAKKKDQKASTESAEKA
ncbi:unnamed protein product [Caenorhabditis auriculariae]|uniref:Uncharacterized protein n=1 Tax=Caenorhabditis auriculariae TaxID=2777116 RepID=A0A8S1HME9_9PELO|nr:unnamed protein product [Caenorhabditis auriculariae]